MGAGMWRHAGMTGYTSVGAGTSVLLVRLNARPKSVCTLCVGQSSWTICGITEMRWTIAISVALLLALGAYAGSAAVSLDGLVQASQSGDAAAVMSRTDLPRLKRSLVDQIVAAYLNRIGQKRDFIGRFLSWGNGPAFAGGALKAPRK